MSQEFNIDSLSPQEMAVKAEAIGVRKAALDFMPLLGLSILAGAGTNKLAVSESGILPGVDPGGGSRGGTVHRQ